MTTAPPVVDTDWRLVAPWWHWPRLGDSPAPGRPEDRRAARVSAPVLQAYDDPGLVNTFLGDPQARLAFSDDRDRVATVTSTATSTATGAATGALPTRSTAGGVRKLFLASHSRYYLVACSLHCDAAGFPRTRRQDVCGAGFVVRRRSGSLPGGSTGPAATALREWAAVRRRRQAVEQRLRRARGPLRVLALSQRLSALTALEQSLQERVRDHAVPAVAEGAVSSLLGWLPAGVGADGVIGPLEGHPERSALTGVGCWSPVEELPETVAEASYALTPLVPDPTRPDHDAAGESLFFGVVPTGSSDVDPTGAARFDDETEYELRCWVRRHRPSCPADGPHRTCQVTWSEPTEPYRLAGHFDLEGSALRPVTVQLPDLRQLHADALRLGPGGGGGVRFRTPPRSQLAFTSDGVTAERDDDEALQNEQTQVCSFAIPLITIVAYFVLQLFLPIVVFVFQLWWMLLLRFCLPPDVKISGALLADFEALGGGLDVDAGAAATLASRPGFRAALTAELGGTRLDGRSLDDALADARSAPPPDRLDTRSYAAIGRGALAQEQAPARPGPFAARVTRAQVVRP